MAAHQQQPVPEHDPWTGPEKDGLYDPQLEKEACGVGFIVAIDGKRTNKVSMRATEGGFNICRYYTPLPVGWVGRRPPPAPVRWRYGICHLWGVGRRTSGCCPPVRQTSSNRRRRRPCYLRGWTNQRIPPVTPTTPTPTPSAEKVTRRRTPSL